MSETNITVQPKGKRVRRLPSLSDYDEYGTVHPWQFVDRANHERRMVRHQPCSDGDLLDDLSDT
jgi:hypothetical protein